MKWPWMMVALSCTLFASACAQTNRQTSPIQQSADPETPLPRQTNPITLGNDDPIPHTMPTSVKAEGNSHSPSLPAKTPKSSLPTTGVMNVRGIYVSRSTFVGPRLNRLVQFVKSHGMNAMVVDVKDDHGVVLLNPMVRQNVQRLKRQHIYLIARMVTFKDPYLAKSKPALAIRSSSGGAWTQNGVPWVDPYRPDVWHYNLEIAKRAVAVGFDEIQWDYVRFPDVPAKKLQSAVFANPARRSRSDDISAFLRYAKRELGQTPMSADVFGLVTSAANDMGIGQQWEKIAPYVNAISPMMYPSHYSPGVYGLRLPERSPHLTIERGLRDALKRNRSLRAKGFRAAVIRPWLQDFDMRVPYGQREVQAQIRAVKEVGVNSYLLWNQGNNYTE